MNTINNYLESLFTGVPMTEETAQLKADLQNHMEDRFQDLLAQGIPENEAIGTVISEFGSIDEVLEEMNVKQRVEAESGQELSAITMGEALEYLDNRRRNSLLLAGGIAVIILGLAVMLTFFAMFAGGFGEMLGIVSLFFGAAIGVSFIIIAGMSMSTTAKKLSGRFIAPKIKRVVTTQKEHFNRSFVTGLVLGIALCIMSVAPVIVSNYLSASERMQNLGIAVMFLLVAVGVFLIVYCGVIMGSFTSLLENDYFVLDEEEEEKEKDKPRVLIFLESVYWPLVVLIYLSWSFLTGSWEISWVVFPIAGVFFGVVRNGLYALRQDK
ncbi:permease prefix domain 1-containing protein [Enterococcus canis]|nr:permease prefix domain 1-containing protein [Enterococcus canis]